MHDPECLKRETCVNCISPSYEIGAVSCHCDRSTNSRDENLKLKFTSGSFCWWTQQAVMQPLNTEDDTVTFYRKL